jgi:ParB/RepB/Spo0J family partition protein
MSETIKTIALSKLIANPGNPNVMSREKFNKLIRNIERTGLYEPIVVRPHPQKQDCFEIINGHHRVKALIRLGRKEADCVIWNVDDEQTAVLLATLNRLCGSDEPAKKIALLKELTKRMGTADLAKILPQTAKQIEQLTNLKFNAVPLKPDIGQFAIPLVFFVGQQQKDIIENALSSIASRVSSDEMTKAQRRAAAITKIAEHFLAQTNGGLFNGEKL